MGSAITHAPLPGLLAPAGASLELALHAARAGVWEWDLRTDQNRWTEEVWRLHGLSPGEQPPSYQTWLSSIHPDDRDAAMRAVSEARRAGAPFEGCWRTLPERGPVRWLLSRGQPGLLTRDGPTHYVGIVMDVTSQKASDDENLRWQESSTEVVPSAPPCPIRARAPAPDHPRRRARPGRLLGQTALQPLYQPRLQRLVRHDPGRDPRQAHQQTAGQKPV